MNYNAPQKLDQ